MKAHVSKATKACLKLIGFAGSILLTIFAGIFAMMSLSALFLLIIEKDPISVMGCIASGIVAWILWDIRKDTLV